MQREYKISLSQEFYSDVVYLSQYDEDYPLIFTVFDKYAKANSINGCTAELTGLRPDGMGFTYTSTAVGHTVSFTIGAMLTGLAGAHTAEIIFYKDITKRMGTANIRIVVEPAARPDGTIDGDVERCEEIAAEVQEIVDTAAATVKGEAEAWAVGQRDGVDVPSTDPAYENNAKFYAEQAAQIAEDISGVTEQVATNTSDISDLKEDLPKISGWNGISSNFSKGNYTVSGPNTDPTRVYMVIQNVGKGSKIIFDSTKVHVNYYYITSPTNYAYLYTPNFWDVSGEITLTYTDDGVVFIVAKDATDSSARISDNIPLVNSAIKIYNIKKNSLSKETLYQTLCNAQGKTALSGNFAKGSYTSSGPTTDPTRIYMIVDNMNSGSYVEFDASRIALNYYYIKSKTDFTNLYSPNAWDTSGKIVFSQSDKGNTVFIVAKDVNNGSSMIGAHPELLNNAITIFANEVVPRKVNWVAYGDSITNGSYSTSGGGTSNDMYHSYAYRIAKTLCSDKVGDLYNCGIRGIGWINTGNNGETFDDMLALFTGDKSTIQLVTIMLGINDYLSNETIGDENATEKDGTISGNIRYGLRWIGENYPNARVVVISPMNSAMHGNAGTAWSRKASLLNAHTLDDVASIIKYWCNFFGVRYIDELTEGYINTYNISNYLLDYIHPSDDGQWMLAQDVASKIF